MDSTTTCEMYDLNPYPEYAFASIWTNPSFQKSDNTLFIRDNDPCMPCVEDIQDDKSAVQEEINLMKSIYQNCLSMPVESWKSREVMQWLIIEAEKLECTLFDIDAHNFDNINGYMLKQLSREQFNHLSPEYGNSLYDRFQSFIKSELNPVHVQANYGMPYLYAEFLPLKSEPDQYFNLDEESKSSVYDTHTRDSGVMSSFDIESDSGIEYEPPSEPEVVRRKPGRPKGTRRKKKPEKLGRLWEFIRDLLHNPMYCPDMICWENYEKGEFRFVKSDAVAKLWGSKKDNDGMNYEKLSRAMRYYYKSDVLQPVLGRRLVYKFGGNAKGWRTSDPFFRNRG